MNRYLLFLILVGLQANIALSNPIKNFFNTAWRYFKPTVAYATVESKSAQAQPNLENDELCLEDGWIEYIEGQRNYSNRIENLDRKTIEANITEKKCLFGSFWCKLITKTVGYITYGAANHVKPFDPEQGCRIGSIEVDPEYRRRGIAIGLGKMAYNDMQSKCRCHDITFTAVNPASQALASKFGAQKSYPENEYDKGMYFKKQEECSRFKELWKEFSAKFKK